MPAHGAVARGGAAAIHLVNRSRFVEGLVMGDSAPQVGVIMGSQSDWPTMAHAVQILEQFGIAHEVQIVSAHRTPDRLVA